MNLALTAFDGALGKIIGGPILDGRMCVRLQISVGSLVGPVGIVSRITWCEQNNFANVHCLKSEIIFTLYLAHDTRTDWPKAYSFHHGFAWVAPVSGYSYIYIYPSVPLGLFVALSLRHLPCVMTQVANRVRCKEPLQCVCLVSGGRKRRRKRQMRQIKLDTISSSLCCLLQRHINWYSEWQRWWHTFRHLCDLNANESLKLATWPMSPRAHDDNVNMRICIMSFVSFRQRAVVTVVFRAPSLLLRCGCRRVGLHSNMHIQVPIHFMNFR